MFASRGARVTAVDPNASRFVVGRSVAERHGLDVRFLKDRMEALDLPDAAFDVAVMNNTLCYVVEPAERVTALREAARIVRSGAWIVTRNPNAWFPVDHFAGLPVVPLLPPGPANRIAARKGRKAPEVRLTSPLRARASSRRPGSRTSSRRAQTAGRVPACWRPSSALPPLHGTLFGGGQALTNGRPRCRSDVRWVSITHKNETPAHDMCLSSRY